MKVKTALWSVLLAGVYLSVCQPQLLSQHETLDSPETVLAKFRVRTDQLEAFLRMMPKYRTALRQENLVTKQPYVLLQGEEEGKPIIVEVFTWRNHEIPDHVPRDIQGYWNQMHSMVEDRAGHQGIEFQEMRLKQASIQ